MRALIIENNPEYRELLSQSLARKGFKNDTGDSIAAARGFADRGNYDIICVNQHLRDGAGERFVEFCNQHNQHRDTPILFLTENRQLVAEDLAVHVDGVIHELNHQQIQLQVVHFVDRHLDPVLNDGRILFVEDDEAVANDILEQLRQTGYQVSYCRTAEEAWEEFDRVKVYGSHAEAFDLAITEIDLVGTMQGEDLVKSIRAINDGRGFIPIVAITDENNAKRRIALYRRGVNDFLHKPVLHEELLVRIKNLITGKRLLDEVHNIRREIYAQAMTDELTGCHNRHSLMEFSDKFVAQARRHAYPVSIMVVDLDHFKKVNDNHGHAVGDIVLRQTGELLNRSFREGDLVSRYGGEEFVILLPHCGADDAMAKAEDIRAAIERLEPNGLGITTSIGVSSLEAGVELDFEALFQAGDAGVYEAKESGRNRVVYVAPGRN